MHPFPRPSGLWIPLITPFCDGAVDLESLRRLVRHYADVGVSGLIVAATTGEGLFLDAEEIARIVETSAAALNGRQPLFMGIVEASTQRAVDAIRNSRSLPIDGYLMSAPHYVRPTQHGLRTHFEAAASATERPIMLYNIPYRTGVNIANETVLALAAQGNIVGIKDCCASLDQSFDLMRRRPAHFGVLTGEDRQYLAALSHGADGAILASAHVCTTSFRAIGEHVAAGNMAAALQMWRQLADLVALLFAEPNPAPVKYCLWKLGMIRSPDVRRPLMEIDDALKARIDSAIVQGYLTL